MVGIRLSGLPGSGKSTFGEKLSKALNYRLFRIDKYREAHDKEFWVLLDLFGDMFNREDNFIIDSVGFNRKMFWVYLFLPIRIIDIKLICERDVLIERIAKKELPNDENFPYQLADRLETRNDYADDFFNDMAHKDANFVYDTSYMGEDTLLKWALKDLRLFGVEKHD